MKQKYMPSLLECISVAAVGGWGRCSRHGEDADERVDRAAKPLGRHRVWRGGGGGDRGRERPSRRRGDRNTTYLEREVRRILRQGAGEEETATGSGRRERRPANHKVVLHLREGAEERAQEG
jgi:hypothetical protein